MRHRDFSTTDRLALTPQAKLDDELTKNWSSQLHDAITNRLPLCDYLYLNERMCVDNSE